MPAIIGSCSPSYKRRNIDLFNFSHRPRLEANQYCTVSTWERNHAWGDGYLVCGKGPSASVRNSNTRSMPLRSDNGRAAGADGHANAEHDLAHKRWSPMSLWCKPLWPKIDGICKSTMRGDSPRTRTQDVVGDGMAVVETTVRHSHRASGSSPGLWLHPRPSDDRLINWWCQQTNDIYIYI